MNRQIGSRFAILSGMAALSLMDPLGIDRAPPRVVNTATAPPTEPPEKPSRQRKRYLERQARKATRQHQKRMLRRSKSK